MLKLLTFGFLGLFSSLFASNATNVEQLKLLSWQNAQLFQLATQDEPQIPGIVDQYLQTLQGKGINKQSQGVWIQADWAIFEDHQGKIPASAASLTKVATSLAVLEQLGTKHQFKTEFYTTGSINDGVLTGDLIVKGGDDPLFVWEDAIALGNTLNQMGIKKVNGNLVIIGNFAMNFSAEPLVAGRLLQQGINSNLWNPQILRQYQQMRPGTAKPQVAIAGTVQLASNLQENAQILVSHDSMTVVNLLKQMNIYSNNEIAEMLAQSVGGSSKVAQIAAQKAEFPANEIQLINGSGLGVQNRISPRAVCQMFMAINTMLQAEGLSVADIFPVAGLDHHGTMQWRNLPPGTTIKTGTLNQVSALAGVIPTKERGNVWFAVINSGSQIEMLRNQQDQLLHNLTQDWNLENISNARTGNDYLGNPQRFRART